MEQENDAQLVKKYLKGDEHALRLLYERHIPAVYNFIARISPSEIDVDDIVQEAFVKAWKNLKKFNLDLSFRTWLFTIAKNVLLDQIKKKRPMIFSLSDQDDAFIDVEDSKPLPDAMLDIRDSDERVAILLNELTPAQRATVVLHVMEDLTFREIGEVLGQPMETVKTRYRRAIASLSKQITNSK
ncbi:MAG: RNA polymerase sigma factor [Patescibacteria group bacterium]|jgi:RNA polymerase sigma-70 factor (ECF subfamily)